METILLILIILILLGVIPTRGLSFRGRNGLLNLILFIILIVLILRLI
jgi:hypothetical protein